MRKIKNWCHSYQERFQFNLGWTSIMVIYKCNSPWGPNTQQPRCTPLSISQSVPLFLGACFLTTHNMSNYINFKLQLCATMKSLRGLWIKIDTQSLNMWTVYMSIFKKKYLQKKLKNHSEWLIYTNQNGNVILFFNLESCESSPAV
jgi:hypothetical protein